MNDTQSGAVSGRGCQVSLGGRSASSSGFTHLRQTQPSPPPISPLGRREVVPGWSRAYQLARQECLHRVTTNQQPPPTAKTSNPVAFETAGSVFQRRCVGGQSVLRQRGKCSQWKNAGRQPEPEQQQVSTTVFLWRFSMLVSKNTWGDQMDICKAEHI